MPKSNTAGKVPANKQKGSKICTCCHEEKKLTNYYVSYSPLYSIDRRVHVCKECCKSMALNDDGSVNEIKLNELLRSIDKPYYKDLILSSEKSVKKENSYVSDEEVKFCGSEILQKYFTLIAMRQDRAKSYSDSEKDGFMHQNNNRIKQEKEFVEKNYNDVNTQIKTNKKKDIIEFIPTPEMIELFGDGYEDPLIYKKMYEKYEKLKLNYSLQTNLHQEALATYVRFKVQEEISTAEGDVTAAKKWYDAAMGAAESAKLTPKQLTQSDLQGGLNSFSEIFKAVEQAVEVIPILPKFKFRPNDALDFNIWCYVNYIRDLQGLPSCEYEDVYKFYDKKKQEYLDQYGDPYGIFDEDTSEKNRESIKKFITLPKDYEEGDE